MRSATPVFYLTATLVLMACSGTTAIGTEVIGVGGDTGSTTTGGSGIDYGGGNWGGAANGGSSAVGTGATGGTPVDVGGAGATGGATVDVGGAGATGGASVVGPVCGNGLLETGESCDDANTTPGDGCSGVCRVEVNYICPTPGQLCVLDIVCGDGKVSGNEVCDDGNTNDGDGCASDCMSVDPGYSCPTPGQLCVIGSGKAVCGNSAVETGETCDDGNAIAGDGCSDTCQIEAQYTCPTPGKPCQLNQYCSDGILNGQEQCDDGNLRPGDCCDGNCHLEPNCKCVTPSPALVPPMQVCTSTMICGNGIREGSEACDDGNTTSGDGCSVDCTTVEPGYNCPSTGGACTAVPKQICGNSILETGEYCDDGNTTAGDGCSADCQVESGYTCSAPGKACVAIARCGDGTVDYLRGETCDDGGTTGGNGCSANCTVENGWSCDNSGQTLVPPIPSICTNTTVCGDKKITGAETCDDGNTVANDGCSSSCQLQAGWVCPIVGAACRAAACGDKIVAGSETCDDGGTKSGDGCSSTCQREDGWVCPTAGQPCRTTVCGDKTPEGSEQCDDGNLIPYDGCSPTCTREPACAGGTCTAVCGDGLKFPQEACDDGNTRSGDGCSSTCTIESGWSCNVVTQAPPATLSIPILIRDVMYNGTPTTSAHPAGHPDFEQFACSSATTGLLNNQLGTDGKPQFLSSTGSNQCGTQITSSTSFASWYHDDPLNTVIASSLALNRQTDGSYVFDSANDAPYTNLGGFFPINSQGWASTASCQPCQVSKNRPSWCNQCPKTTLNTGGVNNNFSFTSELRYQFTYKGGEVLNFTGDDDVWVFINGRLAVDLGGLHSKLGGSVTLDAAHATSLGLAVDGMYGIALFQAERHTTASNYKLTLNGFVHEISQCTSFCGDAIVTGSEACDLGTAKNTGAYGTCTAKCTLTAYCGDGTAQTPAEQCDDGTNVTLYDNTKAACAPGCVRPHYCGDGVLDSTYGELCDSGSANSDGAYGPGLCNTKCMPAPYCGDGSRTSNEQCDDGLANGTPASLCGTDCVFKCGNGVLDPGEQCDRGASNNVGGYGGCNANCTLGPYCGDGFKQALEECDDGKNDGSYGTCMPGCTVAGYCGDMTLQNPPEACDDGGYNSVFAYGVGLCTNLCQPAPYCGDKQVQGQFGEKCDDGKNTGEPGSCMVGCVGWVPLTTCGNGIVDSGEQCDDGAANGSDGSPCDVHCRFHCGNGVVDVGESCDDGVNDGSYGGCTSGCQFGPYCGDGTKNGPEQCDLGGKNSASAYGVGACTTSCKNAPYCGDGRVQSPQEACDGQANCTNKCQWWTPT